MSVSIRDSHEANAGTIDNILVNKGIEIWPDHPASKIYTLVIGRVDLHVKRLIEPEWLLGAHEEPINGNISYLPFYGTIIGYHSDGPPGFDSAMLTLFNCNGQLSSSCLQMYQGLKKGLDGSAFSTHCLGFKGIRFTPNCFLF